MVTLYRVTMKPFGAHGHATAKRDHATLIIHQFTADRTLGCYVPALQAGRIRSSSRNSDIYPQAISWQALTVL
jgi:hypothetical protein